MRNRLMIVTAALVLASVSLALAQDKPAEKPPEASSLGSVSIGFQGSSVTGDKARFERYRDLRSRQNIQFDFAKDTDKYFFDVTATNVGNRDGSYAVGYANKKVKFEFSFDSTPLNYGYNTSTPYSVATTGTDPVLSLNSGTRADIEAKRAGVIGIPSSLAQWTGGRSVWAGLAAPFDLQNRRDTIHFGLGYAITDAIDAKFEVTSHKRSGYQPFGAGFAFNNATEIPLPIDDRSTEIEAGIDWANDKAMFRLAYERSMYNNTYTSVTWDSPIRATDYSSAAVTGWDASGYSNGNGPARGRFATSPDNSMSVVTATGLWKFAHATSLSGNLALINMSNDAALIPWTINPVVANSKLCSATSGIIACTPTTLPASANTEVKGVNASFVFNTRPMPKMNVTARYRYNNHDNRSPIFDYSYNVRFDAVPESTPGVSTEPYTITQNKFDIDASFAVLPYSSIKVGYGIDANSKTYLVYRKLTDNTLRASFDTMGNQWVTLRAMYEYTKRSGSEFHQEAITDAGGQANSRLFDDAERKRNRATLLATITPMPAVDFTVSYARGKDDYDIGLNPQFGLLNNDNNAVNVAVNVSPKPQIAFGMDYGREKFNSLQASRTANPFSGVAGAYESWNDPNRNWDLTNDETVNTFTLYFNLLQALPKTDIRIGYDYSDSDQGFVHGGPRVQGMQTNSILTVGDAKPCSPTTLTSCFEAFPNVTNKWQRLTFDLRYNLTRQIGIGASYWYEKFEVTDFATVDTNGPVGYYPATGTPRIDYLGEISTGYGNRPYSGSTGIVRVIYMF